MGFRFQNLNSLRTRLSALYKPHPIQTLNSHLQHHSLILHQNSIYSIPRRWHLGHSHGPDEDYGKEGEKIFRLGLAADIGLATGKALTGYLSGSTAIIADAAHSVSDVVLSSIALLSFKVAKAPRDKEHPYGHGKFETLGALGISCMLLGTAGGIAWHALDILMGLYSANPEVVSRSLTHHSGHHHGVDMEHPSLALSMMVLSIAVKEGLYWITKQAGEKQGSGLMKANAWHHRADAISSVVALIGVGGSILGVKFLDPLAGLLVSGMILKAGIETGHQSILELVDAAIPTKELDPIKQTILQVEGMKGCHRLRGRRAGSSLYLDVHIEVDPFCSVSAAHDIGEKLMYRLIFIISCGFSADPSLPTASPNAEELNEFPGGPHQSSPTVDDNDIDAAVSSIISSKFAEKMIVERVTHHLLQGKMFLQIQVSMPPDILIRDAIEVAKGAEEEISKAATNITRVSIQLRLGSPIPELNH
ncbi:metal tolerance protein 2 isoform X3 [Argentina anserina]|uniref:metal tolerance protein 2 isoform X3 n=1 Tax=Argentina anserina TaxID=57926 RepID=UPI0021766C95|nr:metal tolerance protein 2 isoform X3 [Potentilla anserina]